MDNRARAATIRKVERKIRAKYRKRSWVIFFVALAIGIALGLIACGKGWIKVGPSGVPDQTPPAQSATLSTPDPAATETETPSTPTETPEVYVEETPVPTAEIAVQPEDDDTAVFNPYAAFFGAANALAAATPTPTPPPAVEPAATEVPTPTPTVAALLTATPDPATLGVSLPNTDPSSDEPSAQATQPAQVVSDPNAKGSKSNPIPATEPYSFETQILADGSRRVDVSNTSFDTVRLTMTMRNYLTPDYFATKYQNRYKLTGTEAGAEISLKVDSSTGTAAVIPQNVVWITFESEDGQENAGYQLMDAEIAGRYEVAILPGESFVVYKRFQYSPDTEMDYMVITYYLDGQAHKVYFKLEVAAPAIEYEVLARGARGDAVKKLQERLVQLGYLNDTADGIFGGNTETAIREVQQVAGLAVSGVADNQFQHYVYSSEAVPKS